MSQLSKDLTINTMQQQHLPPDQCGSKLKESEPTNHNAHGDQPFERQGLGGHNNIGDQQKQEEEVKSQFVIDIDRTAENIDIVDANNPHNNNKLPPHEGSKLEVIIFGLDMVGALVNFAVSSSAKEHKLMIYTVAATTIIGFLLLSLSLILNKKKPKMAKVMQKMSFLFGVFGLIGILGMLFPPSVMWWFTVPTFIVFLFVFIVVTLIGKYHSD